MAALSDDRVQLFYYSIICGLCNWGFSYVMEMDFHGCILVVWQSYYGGADAPERIRQKKNRKGFIMVLLFAEKVLIGKSSPIDK